MGNNSIQIFRYNGSPITFNNGDSVMVNASEMAKPFGKLAAGWLRNQSTRDYITELAAMRNCIPSDLVQVVNGDNGGTWMHEDVALEFARWLSPKFAIWCNDRIKELLQTGVSTVRNDDEAIAYAMEVLNKRLSESKQRVQMLEGENTHLQEQNKALAPKAQYTDEVLQSTSTYTFTQCAKELDFRSVNAFLHELKKRGIVFKQSGQYQLTSKFAGKGYTATRTARYYHADGRPDTSTSTVITEKGRMWLHGIFNRSNA